MATPLKPWERSGGGGDTFPASGVASTNGGQREERKSVASKPVIPPRPNLVNMNTG